MDINRLTVDAYDTVLKRTFLLMLFPAATVFVFGNSRAKILSTSAVMGGGVFAHFGVELISKPLPLAVTGVALGTALATIFWPSRRTLRGVTGTSLTNQRDDSVR